MNASQRALLTKARRSLAAARRLAADGDFDFEHSAVIAAFGHHFAKDNESLREFHYGIVEAQDARNAGDYQMEAILSAEDVAVTSIEPRDSSK